MTTSTWEAPRGPGPTKLTGGIPLLLVGLTLVLVLPSLDAGEVPGSEPIGWGLVAGGAVVALLGLLLCVLGARTALWRRRVARDGVRAEGVVVERKATTIRTTEHGGYVVELTVRHDEPAGVGDVVVREIGGAEVGRRVVVRYDADRPSRAVLLGKAPVVRDPAEVARVAASWAAWERGEDATLTRPA